MIMWCAGSTTLTELSMDYDATYTNEQDKYSQQM